MDITPLVAFLAVPVGLGWWMMRQLDSARRDLDRWPEPGRTVTLPESLVDLRDHVAASVPHKADGSAAAAG